MRVQGSFELIWYQNRNLRAFLRLKCEKRPVSNINRNFWSEKILTRIYTKCDIQVGFRSLSVADHDSHPDNTEVSRFSYSLQKSLGR